MFLDAFIAASALSKRACIAAPPRSVEMLSGNAANAALPPFCTPSRIFSIVSGIMRFDSGTQRTRYVMPSGVVHSPLSFTEMRVRSASGLQ